MIRGSVMTTRKTIHFATLMTPISTMKEITMSMAWLKLAKNLLSRIVEILAADLIIEDVVADVVFVAEVEEELLLAISVVAKGTLPETVPLPLEAQDVVEHHTS